MQRWLMQKGWNHFTVRDINRNGPRFARQSSDHTASLFGRADHSSLAEP
jgi:hypothetical protein